MSRDGIFICFEDRANRHGKHHMSGSQEPSPEYLRELAGSTGGWSCLLPLDEDDRGGKGFGRKIRSSPGNACSEPEWRHWAEPWPEPGFAGGGGAGAVRLGVFSMNMTFGAMRENGATEGVSAGGRERGHKDRALEHAMFKKWEQLSRKQRWELRRSCWCEKRKTRGVGCPAHRKKDYREAGDDSVWCAEQSRPMSPEN